MRTVIFLSLLLVLSGATASDSRAADQQEILRLAVTSAAERAWRNWELDATDELLLSDRTIQCSLPQSAAEEARMDDVLERSIRGEEVANEEFEFRSASPNENLLIEEGRDVPRAIVAQCLRSSGGSKVPSFELPSSPRVHLQPARRIDSVFRQRGRRWESTYPHAVGVIYVSDPLFTSYGTVAFVKASRLLEGIGGGSLFYRLEKEHGRWRIAWEEMMFME